MLTIVKHGIPPNASPKREQTDETKQRKTNIENKTGHWLLEIFTNCRMAASYQSNDEAEN
jgi:hypothetical protein